MSRFDKYIDRRYAKICLYASVTVLLTMAAIMVLYTASPVFNTLWLLICAVLEPVVYGAAISYVLNPLVVHISHALGRRSAYAGPEKAAKRRSTAVIHALVLVALFLLAIMAIFVLMITHSLSGLRLSVIQDLIGDASGDFTQFVTTAREMLVKWGLLSEGGESGLLSIFGDVTGAAGTIVFAILFAVYFLIDGPRVTAYLARVAKAILGDHVVDPSRMIADADRLFSGYFRGQGIDAVIVGVLSGLVLTAIGVPYAPVVGLLAGLGNLIPYVGGPVGFASIVLMCVADAAWGKMIAGIAAMAVVMFVDANIINPKLLSDNVEVHPILVVAALIAGGAVGGIAGMLVAVPLAAFIKLQVDRWVERREQAQAASEDGAIVESDEAPAIPAGEDD